MLRSFALAEVVMVVKPCELRQPQQPEKPPAPLDRRAARQEPAAPLRRRRLDHVARATGG